MKQVALLVLASALSLILAEGLVRLLPASLLGFEYGVHGFGVPMEYDFDAALAAQGAPLESPPPRRPGSQRVLLLGDSYVAAVSVKPGQRVGARLECHVREAGATQVEVLAWGKGGWSPERELAVLQERGSAAEPDLVVTLFLTLNDVRAGSKALTEIFRQQATRLVSLRMQGGAFPASRAPLFFLPSSRLNQLLSYRLALWGRGRDESSVPIDYFVYASELDSNWRGAWAKTEDLLRRTRAEAERMGAGYAIVSASTPHGVLGDEQGLERLFSAYPGMRGRAWDLAGPDRRLARFAESEGIPFLALEPAFRAATQRGRQLHWRYDGHWNAEGNDLAGELMAEFIVALLPE